VIESCDSDVRRGMECEDHINANSISIGK
jgi:hypothetical protein